MSSLHGKFVWYELMTTDLPAAETFYGSVIGWGTKASGFETVAYTELLVGDIPMGGMLDLPPDVLAGGARPAWIGYIAVDDVDACQQRVLDAGGSLFRPAADIPNVGRFAVMADPQGAPFVLFRGRGQTDPLPAVGTAQGTVGWRELMAADSAAAFDFYAALFGWTKGDGFDMGPMGTYQLWNYSEGDSVGGMMTKPPSMPIAFWAYYIRVDALGAAIDRVKAGGGQIVNGPHSVPGDDWVAQGFDPQGAFFSLVSRVA